MLNVYLMVGLATVLFLVGLRLSAFFSGSETGFYRLSFLRLSIDAQAGDRVARQLIWFSRNPGYFVATTLVGNNVANYVATAAIGLFAATLVPTKTGVMEIVCTLLMAPVIFVLGELVPKNLYYRAPLYFLRRDARWFQLAYYLFLPVSFPLVLITQLLERWGRRTERELELVLGRSRLVQVLSQGHREGLLTDAQSRLIHGVLHTAAQPVTDSITPSERVLGMADTANREELLEFARKYGTANIPLAPPDTPRAWHSYVRAIDLSASSGPLNSLIRKMPPIDPQSSKLEALLTLRQAGATYGVIASGADVVGLINEQGLLEQLFRSPQVIGARPPVRAAEVAG